MHDRLFANYKALEPWNAHAEALGLDVPAFEECLASGRHASGVRRDMREAAKVGVTGTPSFVLGTTDPEDPKKVKGLKFIRGAKSFATFKTEIDSALPRGAAVRGASSE